MAKVAAKEGLTPKEMDLGQEDVAENKSNGSFRLKKELGLMNGVAIIVGVIVGSGIFVSPNIALKNAGSKGMALIIWGLSGMLSMVGALCYAELGTMIPKSGGDYAYLGDAFGPLPAFLYLWVALIVLVPTGNAITALTFAKNILQPMWMDCKPPDEAVVLLASLVTCFLTVINCYDVKWVTRVQDSFTAAKVLALIVTFCASLYYVFSGHTENLHSITEVTNTEPSMIAIAFYSGLFSYSGWNYLNYVTEELKEPQKNLPRAIWISMPVVTLVYLLINFAFFVVLTTPEIIVSEAVAVKFSDKVLTSFSWIMPLFVALCTFGSLNGAIYASSRLFFVGARNGQLPLAISLIHIDRLTPVPSLIFMCFVTLVVILTNAVESLVVYVTAVEALFTLGSVAGLLWLRRKHPDWERPIKINLILPVAFLLIVTVLVVFSCISKPVEVGIGIGIIALGIPIYGVFIMWQNKPTWLKSACNKFNLACALLFRSYPEDSYEKDGNSLKEN